MIFISLCALTVISLGIFMYYQVSLKRAVNDRSYLPMPNGQRVEVNSSDPTDPMRDPDVRAMLSEVIRTGRPMSMNRGEKPRFLDEASEQFDAKNTDK